MRIAANATLLALLLALTSCSTGEIFVLGENGSRGNTAKGDRGDDGATPLDQALLLLKDLAENGETELQRALAEETVARIEDGDVWIGPVSDARGVDLWHMCKDIVPDECGDRPTDEDWRATPAIQEAIEADLDGYQWGNRLYFTGSDETDPRKLAATLVHEVNHVLNRSECYYYDDYETHEVDQTGAFLEEFRAFYVECWLNRGAKATPEACREHAVKTMDELEYGLTPDFETLMPGELNPLEQIAEELVESRFWMEGSFGYLIPSWFQWPEDFEPCD